MRILLLNTAGNEGSVALADTGAAPVVVAAETLPGRSASERLVPVVGRMLETAGWRLEDLAALVVVHGPGSFTGVRVGLSAAKGLSEAAGIPLIAVSRLALLAGAAQEKKALAVLDAGRGEYYLGEYDEGRCVHEELLSGDAVLAACAGRVAVVCEAKVAEALAAVQPGLQFVLVPEPLAEDALPVALERIAVGSFDDAGAADANYLRRTDLEIFAKSQPGQPR